MRAGKPKNCLTAAIRRTVRRPILSCSLRKGGPTTCPRPHKGRAPAYILAAVTDFTMIVSPLAVPVTLACSQANLLSSSFSASVDASSV